LVPREEIESEVDPLWSIEIRQWNLGVCKDFDEKVILEANLFQQYTLVFVCLTLGVYTMKKIFPLSFGDTLSILTLIFPNSIT